MVDSQEDEVVMVAAPNHPASSMERPTVKQVADLGFVLREKGSATSQSAEKQFRELAVIPNIAVELGSNQAIKQAAATGGCIGIISKLGIAAELKAGMLTILDVADWDCQRLLTLIQAKDRYLSSSGRAFREFIMYEMAAGSDLEA